MLKQDVLSFCLQHVEERCPNLIHRTSRSQLVLKEDSVRFYLLLNILRIFSYFLWRFKMFLFPIFVGFRISRTF